MKVSAIDSFNCVLLFLLFTWIVPLTSLHLCKEWKQMDLQRDDGERPWKLQEHTTFHCCICNDNIFQFREQSSPSQCHFNTVFVGCHHRRSRTNEFINDEMKRQTLYPFWTPCFPCQTFYATFFRFHTLSIAHHKTKIKVRDAFNSARFMWVRQTPDFIASKWVRALSAQCRVYTHCAQIATEEIVLESSNWRAQQENSAWTTLLWNLLLL